MTNVVVNVDGGTPLNTTVEVSAELLTRVSYSPGDRDTVRNVRVLTAAIISIVQGVTPAGPNPNPPVNSPAVEAFINAQIAAMQQAISILNAV